jgi:hypothetical protein
MLGHHPARAAPDRLDRMEAQHAAPFEQQQAGRALRVVDAVHHSMHAIVEEIPRPIGADRRLLPAQRYKLPHHLARMARSSTADSAAPATRPPRQLRLRKHHLGLGEQP